MKKENKHTINFSKNIKKELEDGEIKVRATYYISQQYGFSSNHLFIDEDEIDWFREQLDKIR